MRSKSRVGLCNRASALSESSASTYLPSYWFQINLICPVFTCALASLRLQDRETFFFFFKNRCLDSCLRIRQSDHTGISKENWCGLLQNRGIQDEDGNSVLRQSSQRGVGGPPANSNHLPPPPLCPQDGESQRNRSILIWAPLKLMRDAPRKPLPHQWVQHWRSKSPTCVSSQY